MASSKKTNKTSHVMNLLTNGSSPEGSTGDEALAEAPAGSGQEKKGDVQSHTVTPSKVTVVDEGSRNDRLSQEIFNKLSEELEEETQADADVEETAQPETSRPDPQPEIPEPEAGLPGQGAESGTGQETSPEGENQAGQEAPAEGVNQAGQEAPAEGVNQAGQQAPTETENQAAQEAPAPQEAPAEIKASDTQPQEADEEDLSGKPIHHTIIPKSKLGDNLSHREYRFVNVMEQLILRQDMVKVLEQYNVCTCARCIADVCALTLSALPAKYVVTSKDSISPLISYYESRNKINVLTAMIKACNMVRENPRH